MNKITELIKSYRQYISELCDCINDKENSYYEVMYKKDESGYYICVSDKNTMGLVYTANVYYDFSTKSDCEEIVNELSNIRKSNYRRESRVS